MIIDLQSIDTEQFYVNEHVLNGEMVYLVIPKQIGVKWTKDNKHFRSSVWNTQGELISASFFKFVNFGEISEVFPVPTSLKNCVIVEKIDGSTLIISKYKGQYIIRTRGTLDAAHMEKNGFEIEIFRNEILPKLINYFGETIDTWTNSVIFEWTSPLNRIVINYGDKPRFVLIGMVDHFNYMLQSQYFLDDYAKELGLERPATYTFTDIESLIANVEKWQDNKEGVVLYYKNDQQLLKIKSSKYLFLHRMKSELSSLEKVIDVWISQGCPTYNDFYNFIVSTFDYELAEYCKGYISNICDGYKEVKEIINGMTKFVNESLLPLGNPKNKKNRGSMAQKVISSYSNTNRANFVFTLLDSKSLNTDDIKKLLYQVLKNR